MCGRFVNNLTIDVHAERWRCVADAAGWQPTWNAAPTQSLPVVFVAGSDRRLSLMQWGWKRAFGGSGLLVNARGEEAAGKRTWSDALQLRRCLVPATAFYEWKEAANQPYAFTLTAQEPFAIAGLWEPTNAGASSFILLTTVANALVAPVHHRMACIVPRDDEDAWLDPASPPDRVQALITPFPASHMTAHAVDRRVNAVANDGPELLRPILPPEQLEIWPTTG